MVLFRGAHKLIVCLVMILFLLFAPISNAQAYVRPAQLKFVFSSPVDNQLTQWLILIYTDALKRMGIDMLFMDVPPKRASLYTDNNKADAELSRVATYNKTHPDMVRVEEHNLFVNFVAYAADSTIQLHGWESLKETNYKVDYRLGITKCEQQLVNVVEPYNLNATIDIQRSFKKLFAGRVDIYVDAQDLAESFLKSDTFKLLSNEQKIYRVGFMEQTTGHAFLHKKHKQLVPELSAILKSMKKEGVFTQYLHQVGLTKAEINW